MRIPAIDAHAASLVAAGTARALPAMPTPAPRIVPVPQPAGAPSPALSGTGTAPPGLPVDRLLELARARPELAWPANGHLSLATNAHYTNRRSQMEIALRGNYNSLEGDVRMRNGVAVMAHGMRQASELTFAQWAQIGAASGRMLRIDVKDADALPAVVDTLQTLKIPSDRISFNASAYQPWMPSNVSIGRFRQVRAAFPDAWITFNVPLPARPGYSLVERAADRVGGKVGVALQAQLATPQLVARLRQHMTVNVWNYPSLWQPDDVKAATSRLRSIGVDGMIDLRRRDDPLANA